MSKHIGIVGGSAPGAALCYQTICAEAEATMGEHKHPEVSLHTFPLADYMKRIDADDWDDVAYLMARSATKLADIGADFAICPDNTFHQCYDKAVEASPIPWLPPVTRYLLDSELMAVLLGAIVPDRSPPAR